MGLACLRSVSVNDVQFFFCIFFLCEASLQCVAIGVQHNLHNPILNKKCKYFDLKMLKAKCLSLYINTCVPVSLSGKSGKHYTSRPIWRQVAYYFKCIMKLYAFHIIGRISGCFHIGFGVSCLRCIMDHDHDRNYGNTNKMLKIQRWKVQQSLLLLISSASMSLLLPLWLLQ